MDSKQIIFIYILGLIILVGAIVFNGIAIRLNHTTWYGFIYLLSDNGFAAAFKEVTFINLLFLFIIYPLLLGFLAFYSYIWLFK